MKKTLLITLASLTIASGAQAAGDCGDGTGCGSTMMLSLVSSMGTSAVVLGPFALTSEALKNDIIAVNTDAAIALETGVASQELLSVIAKIRANLPEQTGELTDLEIVSMMVSDR